MRKRLLAFALAAAACLNIFAQAQTAQSSDPGITSMGVIGEVVAVDANSKQIFVKTDAGSVVVVALSDAAVIMRNPPGEKGVANAVPMALSAMGAGDRAFAIGKISDDKKTLAGARRIIVNTKADINAKQEAERAEWKLRGIVGSVTALNPSTKEITLQTRTPQGPQAVTINAAKEGVVFRRYAPDSVKFADAKPSTFEELKINDQLRAKGERSADGAAFAPEEIVSGSFQTVVGNVVSIDAAKSELVVKQASGDKQVTVVVAKDSLLKRVPAEFGAGMQGGGEGGPRRVMMQGGAGGATPPSGGQGASGQQPGAGGPGGGPVRRMMDMAEMLERLPLTTVAELKPGDMIVVSSTVGADPTRLTAIQLVAGVEPLVAMMARRQGGAPGSRPGGPSGAGGDAGFGFGFGIGQP